MSSIFLRIVQCGWSIFIIWRQIRVGSMDRRQEKKPLEVLVVYYSQTGQLLNIVNSLMTSFKETPQIKVDYLEIKPVKPFSFPWNAHDFFDSFPESVMEIPSEIEQNFPLKSNYHLIILAYQPWFLSPSIPINSFLQSEYATKLLSGTNIVSVIGSRNMWTQAYAAVRRRLKSMGGELVGNIILRDRAYNLISVYTIIRWMIFGKKGNSGISNVDIQHAKVYGSYIKNCLIEHKPIEQEKLVSLGAVECVNSLMLLEQRAIILFRKFAQFVRKKGGPGNPNRNNRLKLFEACLITGLILSPIAFVVSLIQSIVMPKKLKQMKKDFKDV